MTSTLASGYDSRIFSRNSGKPRYAGSKSIISSSGAIFFSSLLASAGDRATKVLWLGANFFSAEQIAIASPSYSSIRRMPGDRVLSPGGLAAEGTTVTAPWGKDGRGEQHFKEQKAQVACPSLDHPTTRSQLAIRNEAPQSDQGPRRDTQDTNRSQCRLRNKL